jgi:membrane protein implicated in regulation of membrane protease activity
MGLDIRLPIGMMFSILGALLAIYGLATGSDSAMYSSSLNLNVNFWWGLVLFLFGAVMLFFALRLRFEKPKKTP